MLTRYRNWVESFEMFTITLDSQPSPRLTHCPILPAMDSALDLYESYELDYEQLVEGIAAKLNDEARQLQGGQCCAFAHPSRTLH